MLSNASATECLRGVPPRLGRSATLMVLTFSKMFFPGTRVPRYTGTRVGSSVRVGITRRGTIPRSEYPVPRVMYAAAGTTPTQ
eukprot:1802525-Rhodomonas_salina.1